MTATASNVIVIPANPALAKARAVRRQLRVAAYCRVSTDSEEQLTSYEAQKKYYTDKIMTNPAWTMAGIFADEGISGTQAAKRPQFLRMIRQCRQKKIDMVLVKSISRFARNTVDCLNYVRALRELGIAIIFEEQNINTLESDGELLITLLGAVSQGESEAISENVKWGKRQAMREGKAAIQYKRLYAYEKGPDGKPRIIPEQAEVVRQIYDSFLGGQSLRMIKDTLERQAVPTVSGGSDWSIAVIRGILQNEKYCGDVLQQKSFVADCISHKHVRNVGQLPMYLTRDHHEGIVSRDTFHAAKAEFARRNAGHAPSQKQAPTGRSCYSAKYALTGRLVCGECGTLYRRCVWSKRGQKKAVWRCASRIDYGSTYCHESPTLQEGPLQAAILAVLSSVMSQKGYLLGQIEDAIRVEAAPVPGEAMSLSDIDQRLADLDREFKELFQMSKEDGGYLGHADTFKRITEEMGTLKEKKASILAQMESGSAANRRVRDAVDVLTTGNPRFTEWKESDIRQLVDTVEVLSADRIRVCLQGGTEIEQTIQGGQET